MKVFQRLNNAVLKPALISTVLLFTSINVNASTYTFTDLGEGFSPTAINNTGQVVGTISTTTYGQNGATYSTSAAIWNNNVLTSLSGLGGNQTIVKAINDSGQVVGYSTTSTGLTHATLWDNSTSATDLGTLGGSTSYANDINNLGQIVGSSLNANGILNATLWNGNTITSIGGNYSTASAINNLGQIVGLTNSSATLWDGSITTQLNRICDPNSGCVPFPLDINDAGVVVGKVTLTEPSVVIWDTKQNTQGAFTNNGYVTLGSGINNAGQFITHFLGNYPIQNPLMQDALRNADGSAPNLTVFQQFFVELIISQNTIIGERRIPFGTAAINDFGSIIGSYQKSDGTSHGYLLSLVSPVPVPAAAWLFASGLGAFGVAKRRSKKS